MVEKSGVVKSGVEKFMVEKSGLERSGVVFQPFLVHLCLQMALFLSK